MRGFGVSVAPAIITSVVICGMRFFWVFCVFPSHADFQTIMLIYPLSLATNAALIFGLLLLVKPSRTRGIARKLAK